MLHQYDVVQRSSARVQQTFSPLVDEYYLDRNGILQLKPVQRDQQALINSVEYTKLSDILDLMSDIPRDSVMSASLETDSLIVERENFLSELDILEQADNLLSSYRAEEGVDPNLTKAQLYKLIRKKAADAEATLINKRKELFANETQQNQTSPQSEQT